MANGHRGRMRIRFTEENIDTIPESTVLEKILHNTILRKDTADVARSLLNEFGSLAQVIDAPEHELMKVCGVGKAASSAVKLIPLFYKKYLQSKWSTNYIFDNSVDVIEYLNGRFIGYQSEVVIVLCLDANMKFLSCKAISEGSINSVDINIRKIINYAMASNASRVIIAHNHLHGTPEPSHDDIETTKMIYNALQHVGLFLDDHIIIAPERSLSLVENGCIPKEKVSDKYKIRTEEELEL